MFKELVDAVQDGVKTEILNVGGEDLATRPLHRLPKVSLAKALEVTTLQSVVDYIKKDIDTHGKSKLFIHISDHAEVDIVLYLDDENRRETRLSASYENDAFSYGQRYDQSTFITLLQSQFVDAGDRSQLQKLIGALTDESSLHLIDDGISQKTTAKTGITTSERVETPNPFSLSPFRTFPELEQPSSDFILRLHRQPEGVPLVSLHECDNQAWKLDAIKEIKTFLENADLDVPIIA